PLPTSTTDMLVYAPPSASTTCAAGSGSQCPGTIYVSPNAELPYWTDSAGRHFPFTDTLDAQAGLINGAAWYLGGAELTSDNNPWVNKSYKQHASTHMATWITPCSWVCSLSPRHLHDVWDRVAMVVHSVLEGTAAAATCTLGQTCCSGFTCTSGSCDLSTD